VISLVLILAVIVGIKGVGRILEPQQVRTATFTLGRRPRRAARRRRRARGGLKVGIVRRLEIESATQGGKDQQPRILVTFHMPERIVLRHRRADRRAEYRSPARAG
jgi:hypothetical protein